MNVFLSDTLANMLERAQTDLAKLLADLRDLHNSLMADADSDTDAKAMNYVDDAFNSVYAAHNDLRAIGEFMRDHTPEPDGPDVEDFPND